MSGHQQPTDQSNLAPFAAGYAIALLRRQNLAQEVMMTPAQRAEYHARLQAEQRGWWLMILFLASPLILLLVAGAVSATYETINPTHEQRVSHCVDRFYANVEHPTELESRSVYEVCEVAPDSY